MDEVASDEVLDLAYDWLCRSRKNAGHNSDVWVVRWHRLVLLRPDRGSLMTAQGRGDASLASMAVALGNGFD